MADVKIVTLRIGGLTDVEKEKPVEISPAARREANRLRIPSSKVQQEVPIYGDESPPDH